MRKVNSMASSSGGGIGFCGLLTIVFIVLKLTKVINWSWWWVWSPVLISSGIVFSIWFFVFVVAMLLASKK